VGSLKTSISSTFEGGETRSIYLGVKIKTTEISKNASSVFLSILFHRVIATSIKRVAFNYTKNY
jgi:hypothetical protein